MKTYIVKTEIDDAFLKLARSMLFQQNHFVCTLFIQMAKEQIVQRVENLFFGILLVDNNAYGGIVYEILATNEVRIDLICTNTIRKGFGKFLLDSMQQHALSVNSQIQQIYGYVLHQSKSFFTKCGYINDVQKMVKYLGH